MNDLPNESKKNRSVTRRSGIIVVCALSAIAAIIMLFGKCRKTVEGSPRAEAEIAAMSVALKSFELSNGQVPSDPLSTDLLRPAAAFDPEEYIAASRVLYKALSGDSDGDPTTKSLNDTAVFFEFRRGMLRPPLPGPGTYVVDPFGNSYGYSTFKAKNPKSEGGYNSTFDLWSTTGGKTEKDRKRWTKNW